VATAARGNAKDKWPVNRDGCGVQGRGLLEVAGKFRSKRFIGDCGMNCRPIAGRSSRPQERKWRDTGEDLPGGQAHRRARVG